MNISAIVFDLDGVLMNSEPVWDQALEDVVGVPSEEIRRALPRGMAADVWASVVCENFAPLSSPREIHQKTLERMTSIYEQELPMFDGAKEAVQKISESIPVGLATSSDRRLVEIFLDRSGLCEHFLSVCTADDVAQAKPHPEIYRKALEGIGAEPRKSIAVEDSEIGMRSALAAGMKVALLPEEGSSVDATKATVVLRDIRTLPGLVLWPVC